MAHWYNEKGVLVESVDGKKTTIREAKKYNLAPSVTAIIDQIEKPGLNIWKLNQLFEAVCPFIEAQDSFDPEEIRREVFSAAAQGGRTAAQLGSYIHSQFEKFILGEKVKEEKLCEDILVHVLKEFGTVTGAEVSFSTGKYGGCIDLVGTTESGGKFIADLKTTNFKATKTAKQLTKKEHSMQLSAYSMGLHNTLNNVTLGNIFIDTSDDHFGRIRSFKWPSEVSQNSWEMFEHLLQFWYLDKGWV